MLEHLRHARGFDFSDYKRASLKRRIDKRMQAAGIADYDHYVDHFEVHPDEFAALFNTILINVTSFFRDPPVWEYVSQQVVPAMLAGKDPAGPVRIWSAACASGEEAYTLAMVLAEALGADAFRHRVKIYATDIDDDALAEARAATYRPRQTEGVPPELLSKYFEQSNAGSTFDKDLRRSIIFGRHDLIQDAPISRVDLIACRNALMYFNAEVQARIAGRFYFALNDGGYLALGTAEMLFNQSNLFVPLDLKRRLFRATPKLTPRDRLLLAAQIGREEPAAAAMAQGRIREAAFEVETMPQIVVDGTGMLVLANDQARRQFGMSSSDVGRLLQDLDLSYRPVDLRSLLDQATVERRSVTLKDIEWSAGPGDGRYLDVVAVPLLDQAGGIIGTKISFADVTRYHQLQKALQHSKHELERAYEELQSTNEALETTNEELQSTVEELETTNEELQSTNEELETMNEELQSTNEELQTMNEELRTRGTELNDVNASLESILKSLRGGIAVVDRNLQIQLWNSRAEDMWGLRADEVRGANLLNLDIGLPIQQLKDGLRQILLGQTAAQTVVLDATNRRGKPFRCRVSCSPLVVAGGETNGVIVVMEDHRDREAA